MLSEALAVMGFETRRALNGPDAITMAADFRPAVTLLDIGLPGMDGFEVARHMRQHPDFAAMKLIAVTGFGMARDHARTTETGFDAHLVKPVDLGDLVKVLNTLTSSAAPR